MDGIKLMVWVIVLFLLLLTVYLVLSFFKTNVRGTSVSELGKNIERACKGEDVVFDFILPQKKPAFIFDGKETPGPDGDPRYLLYYERFPIGDTISWDWLRRENYPLIIYSVLNETTSKNREEYAEKLKEMASQKLPDEEIKNGIDVVFINLLHEGEKVFGSEEIDYLGKFETCGDDYLCLKDGLSLKKYKLKKCEEVGIDYISLYSHRWRVLRLLDIGFEELPFSIASPCVEKAEAFRSECTCKYMQIPIYDKKGEMVGETVYCDNFNLFGGHPEVKIPCVKILMEPTYSDNYCFNREMSDQIMTSNSFIEDILSASGNIAISGSIAILGYLGATIIGGPVGLIMFTAGAGGGLVSAGYLYEAPPRSVRNHCLVNIDENSVAILPSCLHGLQTDAKIKIDSIKEFTKYKSIISEIFSIDKNNAIWEVWPLDRPVI